jgi:hypothetical protein
MPHEAIFRPGIPENMLELGGPTPARVGPIPHMPSRALNENAGIRKTEGILD